MIKQTIKYEDYNEKEVTEDFYFNLTKLEVMEMELHHEGGLSNYIERLTQTTAGAEAYDLFKSIILASCGKKSDDGRRFIKSPEITADFEQSPAMGELIFRFLEESADGAAFVRGLLPAKLVQEVEKEAKKSKPDEIKVAPDEPSNEGVKVSPSEPSDEELLQMKPKDMTHDQLQRAFALKSKA